VILTVSTHDDPTCDDVEQKLTMIGADFCRINTETFGTRTTVDLSVSDGRIAGALNVDDRRIDLESIKSIYYRRPAPAEPSPLVTNAEARHVARQESDSLIRQLWQALEDRFWVSHPAAIRRAEHKLLQLREALALGFRLPATIITQDVRRAREFVEAQNGQVAIKTISGVILEGESVRTAYTHKWVPKDARLLEGVALCPTLLQEYVPKQSELRITVVGSTVFTCEMDTQTDPTCAVDWRRGSALRIAHRAFRLPATLEERCSALVRRLGLQYGAIDMIRTPEDDFVFLEINANGQFGWCEGLAGLPISLEIAQLLVNRERGTAGMKKQP